MSAMANTTPIVTTVTKAANKEKTPKEADAALKVNILDFCEENYEDILPVIMDKIRRDKRIEVHARLDFGETSKKSQRVREGSQNSSVGTLPARYRNLSERPKRQDRLRHNDENVFDRLGQTLGIVLTVEVVPANGTLLLAEIVLEAETASAASKNHMVTCSSYRIGTRLRYHSHDRDRSRSMKRGRESESPLSRVSESGTSDGGHWKSNLRRRKPTGEEDLAVPWSCEEVDPFTPRIRNFKSSQKTRMPNNVKNYDEIGDPKDHRDGETIEDFIERFKVETGRMKGAPECMRIFEFMHGVNNHDLTKCLNEHAPKTMEEMLTTTTAFIQGETAATSKKKGHTSWKLQDQPNWHVLERRSDFRARKFKLPPPMVTPVEKRSSNKFCDFHNDKGHNRDECVQLKKQIKELVQAGKLSHLIKEIKPGKDQPKLGKKEVPAKDKSMEIYMVQPWHRMTRKKVTRSFSRVREITFPSLATSRGTKGPLVIKAEIGGHMIHRMYVDGGPSIKALSNNRRCRIFDKSMDEFHDRKVIITIQRYHWKTWNKRIQAVPSIAHEMLKFPVDGGIVTIRSTILIFAECAAVTTASKDILKEAEVRQGKKYDGSWRMCVDFTNLNKACPQDCYPLSEINWKVESLCDYSFKCFLDAYKGYHQIQMAESGEEKTAFYTSHGVYCYTKMPFGLKNVGATYQRLVDKAFDNQVGRNIEVYLNPKKCTFEAVEGMFLWKLASLNRFLSKSAKKSLPLFKTLKKCIKKSDFHWILEAKQAFKQMKQHLSELPMLVAPKPKDELIVYLSTSHGAISAVLMTKSDTVQMPVYFISRALQGLELNYTPMEKLVLALVFAAKRLRRYFQAYPIAVITDQPIKQIMPHLDVAGRLQEWSVMLGEYNITYRPRTLVKGQILADFLVEKPDEAPPDMSMVNTPQEPWTLFTDRSLCIDGSGSGLILTSPKGTEFTYVLRFQFIASNNEAEYETLIDGLRITAQIGVHNVHVSVDSKLVTNQVLGTYATKEENMIKYLERAKSLVSGFANFSISQVPRSKNKKADALSKIASTIFSHLSKQVLVEILKENTIQEKEVATVVEKDGPTWMTPIMEYLKDGTFLGNIKEARKLCIKAKQYELLEGVLYGWSFLKLWLRNPQQQLTSITAPWPFYKWGINIASPFLEGPRKAKFLIVTIDYFTKWIEAKVMATIIDSQELWRRNKGPPGRGKQELDKRTPHVLCAHRTIIKSSHDDTPFSLTYGTEAVIPVEIEMPMYRTAVVDAVHNNEELQLNLDLLEEMRKRAAISEAKTKLKMTNYYNARVRGVTFKPGDFVYRSNNVSHAVDRGKLGPKWEGPYEVTEALGDGE
nr:reverse transcriptase domain-containing protein [Tanacetum cinerariifolium]